LSLSEVKKGGKELSAPADSALNTVSIVSNPSVSAATPLSARTWHLRNVSNGNTLTVVSQNEIVATQNSDQSENIQSENIQSEKKVEVKSEMTARLQYSLRAFNQKPLKLPLEAPRIEVDKSRRNLMVFEGDEEVRRYGIDLGHDPNLPKEKQGDGRTPEGYYYICSKNDQSRFNLSMGISYPNIEDAQRGLSQGLINQSQFKAIERATWRLSQPPQNTRLGGAVMIHGETRYNGDWTEGCIGLRNEDMQELFSIIPSGTPLHIIW
jgi:murein L,D-transpeptidase YafK